MNDDSLLCTINSNNIILTLGKLPIDVDMDETPQHLRTESEIESEQPPPLPPKLHGIDLEN